MDGGAGNDTYVVNAAGGLSLRNCEGRQAHWAGRNGNFAYEGRMTIRKTRSERMPKHSFAAVRTQSSVFVGSIFRRWAQRVAT